MTEAWLVRAGERQQLLAGIERDLLDRFEELGGDGVNARLLQLHMILCWHLLNWCNDMMHPHVEGDAQLRDLALAKIERIDVFSRTDAEKKQLVVRLALNLFKSASSRFAKDLQREEVHNPQAVFGAGAMDDIPNT